MQMRHIPDASGASLIPFVCDVVASGSVVSTDGWSGYNGLSDYGYIWKPTVLSSSGDLAHVSMPGVHRVASLLDRWILGTHQGSVVPDHLQSYLEEFTFRFNRRTSRSRGLVFRRLLEQAVASPINLFYNLLQNPQTLATVHFQSVLFVRLTTVSTCCAHGNIFTTRTSSYQQLTSAKILCKFLSCTKCIVLFCSMASSSATT